MNEERRTAVLYGFLLISGMVFGIINSVPALESQGYMSVLTEIRLHVLNAVFFQAAMAVAYVLIAVLGYRLVKRFNENLATACFGFRIIAAGFLFVGIASLLLLLWLSQVSVAAGQSDSFYFETTGELLRRGRDLLNHIGLILPWSIGGLILYYSFIKMKIIPLWLSFWGLSGSVLTLLATILYMLTAIEMATPVYFLMNAPTALFELTLAFYLIIKGFDSEIRASDFREKINWM